MELKTKYQYTYFVHSYKIKENKYVRYIQRLLKNPNCSLKIFRKEQDIGIYSYFTPKIRDYMFNTFNFNKAKIRKLNELPLETRAAMLAEESCIMFEYDIKKDIQGKAGKQKGIFFKIQKIQIICFKTGICFLTVKTNVENSEFFSDILNFNYKFNKLSIEETLVDYDKITIQTDMFEDIKSFNKFIEEITGTNLVEVRNINTQKYLTYSYACIDQIHWSTAVDFERIKGNCVKFIKGLPNDDNTAYSSYGLMKVIDKWNYAKLGITKESVTLFTSSMDLNNYTVLPQEFENEYLYTYILLLYMRTFMRIIDIEFKTSANIKETRKKFLQFTKDLWIQEITNEDVGTIYYHNLKETMELESIYAKVKNQYDIFYKELNIEKNTKTNIIISVVLVISLIINILSYIALLKTK